MSTIEKKELDQRKEKMQKKSKMVWIAVLLLCVSGYFLWQFLQRKVEGSIQVRDSGADQVSDIKSQKKLYKGKFIEFFHGSGYVEKSHFTPESGPVVETLLLSTLDVEGRKIAVTVAYRGVPDLTSEPAFQLRQGTPEEYQPKNFQEGLWRGVLFEKNTAPYERTVFFEKNGYIISISITSPFESDDFEEEVLMIVQSLSFLSQ